MKNKTERNFEIYKDRIHGLTWIEIAKKHGLPPVRAKQIFQKQAKRLSKKGDSVA